MVREAGVEPARPEWTLEPELKKSRFNLYQGVNPDAVKSFVNSWFFGTKTPKALSYRLMRKIDSLLDVCWMLEAFACIERKLIVLRM